MNYFGHGHGDGQNRTKQDSRAASGLYNSEAASVKEASSSVRFIYHVCVVFCRRSTQVIARQKENLREKNIKRAKIATPLCQVAVYDACAPRPTAGSYQLAPSKLRFWPFCCTAFAKLFSTLLSTLSFFFCRWVVKLPQGLVNKWFS